MKKNPILITVVLSLLIVSSAYAQNDQLASLAGKKITTIIENSSTPVAISEDGSVNPSAASGPAKKEKTIWETTLDKSAPMTASKKLKRIIFSVPGPEGIEKYDSDNSFESTDGAEDWVKKFVQVLGKPSTRKLVSDNTPPSNAKTDNAWNSDLPPYDPSLYWNGLTIERPATVKIEKNERWETNYNLSYGNVQNQFTILETYGDSIKISIKSKILFNDSNKGSLNANGAPAGMSLGLQKKQTTYEGSVTVDRKSMLILSGMFQIEAISVLNINGSGTDRKSYSSSRFWNTVL
jgi:hypothetical protein